MAQPCQLCGEVHDLAAFEVSKAPDGGNAEIMICKTCTSAQAARPLNPDYWSFLTTSMWSELPAVKVMSYRLLDALKSNAWAQEALDMIYLEPEELSWAEADLIASTSSATRDSNGAILNAGDNVTLIKDLVVKGAGFTAKRGTMVRGISLTDNPDHIEGRVNGQHIVLVAAFLKKSN